MNTVTVIPAVRVSEQVQPEFRVFSHEADALQIDVLRGGCILLGCTRKLTPGKTSVFRYSLKGAVGDVELRFRFYRGEKEVETSSAPYQVASRQCARHRPDRRLLDIHLPLERTGSGVL